MFKLRETLFTEKYFLQRNTLDNVSFYRSRDFFPRETPFNNQASGNTFGIPGGPNSCTVKLDGLKLVHVTPLRPEGGCQRVPDGADINP